MRKLILTLSVVAIAITTPSCATALSQGVFWKGKPPPKMLPKPWHDIHIYGGTALDLGIWGWLTGLKEHYPDAQDGAWAVFLLDLPFSFVADTVLLPLTICEQAGMFGDRTQDDR